MLWKNLWIVYGTTLLRTGLWTVLPATVCGGSRFSGTCMGQLQFGIFKAAGRAFDGDAEKYAFAYRWKWLMWYFGSVSWVKQQKHAGRRNGFLHNADCGADRRGGIAGHFEQFWRACRTMQNGDFGKFCYTQLRHSLCHGWASGPTSFLSRHVLGIKPIEAGYKKIKKVWCANGNEATPVNVTAEDAPLRCRERQYMFGITMCNL